MGRQAVILTGGRSSRFGSDKACAMIGNRPMLVHVAQQLERAGFEIVISTCHPHHECFGYPIIWDEESFQGPLAALRTILKHITTSKIMLVACDTPLFSEESMQHLWRESEGAHIALFKDSSGQPSPLPGIYDAAMLPIIEENIARGEKSLKSLLSKNLNVRMIPETDPLININSREDLEHSFSFLTSANEYTK